DRRRRDRPGRMLRDQPADHPRRSDLYRGRGGPLLRRQHAWRRAAPPDLRAQQRDLAVHRDARGKGLCARAQGRSTPARRAQRVSRSHHLPRRGRGAEPGLHAGGTGARVLSLHVRLKAWGDSKHPNVRCALWSVVGGFVLTLMFAALKHVVVDMPPFVVGLFRTGIALILLLPWLAQVGLDGIKTKRPFDHFLRAVTGIGSFVCLVFALETLILSDS